jgi:hypothetical protein
MNYIGICLKDYLVIRETVPDTCLGGGDWDLRQKKTMKQANHTPTDFRGFAKSTVKQAAGLLVRRIRSSASLQ